MDINQITAAVAAAKTTWTVKADQTRILTTDELRARCGYVPAARPAPAVPPPPIVPAVINQQYHQLARAGGPLGTATPFAHPGNAPGFGSTPVAAFAARPASVDWRTVGGRSVISAVTNQGGCGSCVAFAVTALTESRVMMEHGESVDLSEGDLYYGAGRKCADGWNPGDALSRIHGSGIPLEDEFPYRDNDPAYTTTGARPGMLVRLGSYTSVNDVEQRKTYLANVGPMVGCFDVYEDFSAYGGGVYKHVTGNKVGGHCVQIIGYDDGQQCWICKNSWADWWGDHGFFRIGYGQCSIDNTGFLGIGANPFYGAGGTQLGPDLNPHDLVGRFDGTARQSLLRYVGAEDAWSLIGLNGQLSITDVGSTAGFGQVWDGRPFWTGDFSGAGRTEVLFYYPGDRNWWLGRLDTTGNLTWNLAGNTAGFGQVWDGRPFWTGDFTGDGHIDVLFYYPGDHNWWLGQTDSVGHMTWSLAGNTAGFGQVWGGRPFWTGDFTGHGHIDVAFFYPGDANWWLGQTDSAGHMTWSLAGNTLHAPILA